MNSIINYEKPLATAGSLAVAGLSAAIAVGQPIWPTNEEPAYTSLQIGPSYSSFVAESSTIAQSYSDAEFATDIAKIYEVLSEGQEPLGSIFEAIWDANIDDLYEA